MKINTKILFLSLVKYINCDLIIDVGSRDGRHSLLFRGALPDAKIIALEPNPPCFARMSANKSLSEANIQLLEYAAYSKTGNIKFNVAEADYDLPTSPLNQTGSSSVLHRSTVRIAETVTVNGVRIDELVLPEQSRKIGLWIDVEGAEYEVLTGIGKIRDHVKVIHVETAATPVWQGQKSFAEVRTLLESMGFIFAGSDFLGSKTRKWGDAVFLSVDSARCLGARLAGVKVKAFFAQVLGINNIAVFLKKRCSPLYRFCRNMLIKHV